MYCEGDMCATPPKDYASLTALTRHTAPLETEATILDEEHNGSAAAAASRRTLQRLQAKGSVLCPVKLAMPCSWLMSSHLQANICSLSQKLADRVLMTVQ